MRGLWILSILLCFHRLLFGQAVTQGETPQGVPWAVVELPGGDTEILAVWLPEQAVAPKNWQEKASPLGPLVWREEPASTGVATLMEATEALSAAVSVALVGPLPTRDLGGILAKLELLQASPPRARPCRFADGVVSFLRADHEGFTLSFPTPEPTDPLWELTEVITFLAQRRWQSLGFSGPVTWQPGPCPTITLNDTLPQPRRRLRSAREGLSRMARPVEPGELEAFMAWKRRDVARWAVDPLGVALETCQRLGWGRTVGALFSPPILTPEAASALTMGTFGRFRGRAEVKEREQRPSSPEKLVLDNGATLLIKVVPSEFALLAIGFSGVNTVQAQELARTFALDAAKEGIPSEETSYGGMAAAVVVASPEEVPALLESLVLSFSRSLGAAGETLTMGLQALGITQAIHAENMALLLQLPEGDEEALEAAQKFLGAVPSAGVQKVAPLRPGLSWQAVEAPARLQALAELPETFLGAAAGQLLLGRLLAQGVEGQLIHLPGQLVVSFGISGGNSVQELDSRLEKAWEDARLLREEDLLGASHELLRMISGSAGRVAMRQVLSVFFPSLAGWLEPDRGEVARFLQHLPAYRQLARFGSSPKGA